MMGAVARSCLAAGLEVDGVIPRTLVEAEVELRDCTRLHEVESMHERKVCFGLRRRAFPLTDVAL